MDSCITVIILTQRNNFIRHDSGATSESSSGLTTPADDEMLHSFDLIVTPDGCDDITTLKSPASRTFKSSDGNNSVTPKARTLSKAVSKAKHFAQTLARSNKSAKVGCPARSTRRY
jgi:hypothetical protein